MDPSRIPRHLKRVKAMLPSAFQASSSAQEVPSQVTGTAFSGTYHRILRVFIGDPWDNYEYIRHTEQVMLARDMSTYFKLVNIREYSTSNILEEQIRLVSSIQHPNLAIIHDFYCDNDKSFLITENLDISISQLNLQECNLDVVALGYHASYPTPQPSRAPPSEPLSTLESLPMKNPASNQFV